MSAEVVADRVCRACRGICASDDKHLLEICRRKPAPSVCACEWCCGWVGVRVAERFESAAAILVDKFPSFATVALGLRRCAAYLREHGSFPVDVFEYSQVLSDIFPIPSRTD